MSIRQSLLRSYIVVIVIVMLYLGLMSFMNNFRLKMEQDRNSLLEVNLLWGEMILFMNESLSNWNDGRTYESYVSNSRHFDSLLNTLIQESRPATWYGEKVSTNIASLSRVWHLAQLNQERIRETRHSAGFLAAERILRRKAGLQKLHSLYMELLYTSNTPDGESLAYSVHEYIDAVEFFPIYSSTMNYLFDDILHLLNSEYRRHQQIRNYLDIIFFIVFLVGVMFVSGLFSKKLSRPITTLIMRLNTFIGKSIDPSRPRSDDEINLLENSVDNLISHYTHLSKLAHRLSYGHIETSLLGLPRQGVVGNALKEVAAYQKTLAEAADWIREGKYGFQVEEKSEQDVLARSFNIMSREIAEKISTLTSMFETIDEGILLTDTLGNVMEANQRFLSLMGIRELPDQNDCDFFELIIGGDEDLRESLLSGSRVTDHYYELSNCMGEKIPVKLNARPMTGASDQRAGLMLLVSNESVMVRLQREQERLEAQAVQAELRALRAQINPHFLFNTLNTIAQLIEDDRDTAISVVEKLAELFRYTLLSTKRNTVPLSQELRHIEEYLQIECIRHGSRLNILYNYNHSGNDIEVPAMILQPLIENCIKYGMDDDGNISITVFTMFHEGDLVISISDEGVLPVNIDGLLNNSRTGLRNINRRLMTLYRTNLEFAQPEGRGLVVKMCIPVEGGIR